MPPFGHPELLRNHLPESTLRFWVPKNRKVLCSPCFIDYLDFEKDSFLTWWLFPFEPHRHPLGTLFDPILVTFLGIPFHVAFDLSFRDVFVVPSLANTATNTEKDMLRKKLLNITA